MTGSEHWIEWDGARRTILDGDVVVIGRSRRSDVLLPATDDYVSRRAVEIERDRDRLEIRNTSTMREVRVRPPVGEDVVLRPLSSTTDRGMPAFAVVIPGLHGAEYVIDVHGRGGGAGRGSDLESVTGGRTLGRPFPLTRSESDALVALCTPMLTENGAAAVPATYAEVGRRLGLQPMYVRKVLGRVRDRLTEAGVPGLTGSGDRAADFRLPLARYAIDVGWAYGDE